jgi:cytochrome bd-type quinol oxidase subunit 2
VQEAAAYESDDLALAEFDHDTAQPMAATFAVTAHALRGTIGVRRRRDGVPFAMAILLVASAFLRLGVSFWPYMVPYSVTVQQAAAPVQSLEFLFWGAGIIVFPAVLIYTGVAYWIFRGKVGKIAQVR